MITGTIKEELLFLQKQNEELTEAINRKVTSPKSISSVPLSISSVELSNASNVDNTKRITTAIEKRFNRIIKTRLGSRVMLPTFGSKLADLIDTHISSEFKLKFRHYLADAFFREDGEPWDRELIPDSIKVEKITDSELFVKMIMRDGKVFEYEG
jgi:phage baseplate assembly protein W